MRVHVLNKGDINRSIGLNKFNTKQPRNSETAERIKRVELSIKIAIVGAARQIHKNVHGVIVVVSRVTHFVGLHTNQIISLMNNFDQLKKQNNKYM